jgi:hypothetical protein
LSVVVVVFQYLLVVVIVVVGSTPSNSSGLNLIQQPDRFQSSEKSESILQGIDNATHFDLHCAYIYKHITLNLSAAEVRRGLTYARQFSTMEMSTEPVSVSNMPAS